MRNIAKIYKAYLVADSFFSEKESNTKNRKERQLWSDRRSLNDQAYFVLIFAQLEDHINKQCQKIISKKQASRQWKRRRLWDNIDLNNLDRFAFLNRVALLTDKCSSRYRDIKAIYEIRCAIAHGGSYSPINVPVEAEKMYNIAKSLTA